MTAATTYTVRLGDDGSAKFRSPNYREAFAWAANYALTNWAGKAQLRCGGVTLARWDDGVLSWEAPR